MENEQEINGNGEQYENFLPKFLHYQIFLFCLELSIIHQQ
jgi:hypothetical protein